MKAISYLLVVLTLTLNANTFYTLPDLSINGIIKQEVRKYSNLTESLVKAVIKTESQYDHKAISYKGAIGLMQIMPGPVKDYNKTFKTTYKHNDMIYPLFNIKVGVWYLSQKCIKKHGLKKGISSYFWGPNSKKIRYGYYRKVKGNI